MSDLIRITCPSCGGKLKTGEEPDRLICENCGNGYIVKQTGNTISLADLPSKQSASVVGNGNVVVRVNVGTTEEQRKKEKTPADERLEFQPQGKQIHEANILTSEITPIGLGILSMILSAVILSTSYTLDDEDALLFILLSLIPTLLGLGISIAAIQRGKKSSGYSGLGLSLVSLIFLLMPLIYILS